MTDYQIVWLPPNYWPRLAQAIKAGGQLVLPHAVDSPGGVDAPVSLSFDINAQTLCRGVLLNGTMAPPAFAASIAPSPEQLRGALRMCAEELKFPNVDELCVNIAAGIRQRYGVPSSIAAQHSALSLFPNLTLCRGDLLVGLFRAAQSVPSKATDYIIEANDLFRVWSDASPGEPKNEAVIVYCGIASLTYLGLESERGRATAVNTEVVKTNPWLGTQILRLNSVNPGNLAAIEFRASMIGGGATSQNAGESTDTPVRAGRVDQVEAGGAGNSLIPESIPSSPRSGVLRSVDGRATKLDLSTKEIADIASGSFPILTALGIALALAFAFRTAARGWLVWLTIIAAIAVLGFVAVGSRRGTRKLHAAVAAVAMAIFFGYLLWTAFGGATESRATLALGVFVAYMFAVRSAVRNLLSDSLADASATRSGILAAAIILYLVAILIFGFAR